MDLIHWFVDFFLHLDQHLAEVIQRYGTSTYALLFLIVFLETGLVVTPLLPGDSLLFAAGSFAGLGILRLWPLFFLLTVADAVIISELPPTGTGPWIFTMSATHQLMRSVSRLLIQSICSLVWTR